MSETGQARSAENVQGMKHPDMLKVSLQQRLGNFQLAVDFQVPLGLIVLFGPSGAGKSLTLRSLAGLLQPARGYISLGGQVLLDSESGVNLPPQQRRVGYVPQHYALFPHLTVAENIAFGLPKNAPGAGWRKRRKVRQARVAELLAALELEGLERRIPATLSGGQQQRVALARALAAEPRLLLLDEPFNALDATVRERLRDALRQFQRRFGIPIVLVTHDRIEAQQLADTVVILQHGRVAQIGDSEAIFRAPRTAAIAQLVGQRNLFSGYLASPSSQQQSLPHLALNLENLADTHTQEQMSAPQSVGPESAWLPLPGNELSPHLFIPQTRIAGCIHADEIVVQPWTAPGIPPRWTSQGAAHWLAELIEAQTHDHAIRLLVRPVWARNQAHQSSNAAGTLEIYLSRRQWQAVEVAPGKRLLLEIGPQAIHCFESTNERSDKTDEALDHASGSSSALNVLQ